MRKHRSEYAFVLLKILRNCKVYMEVTCALCYNDKDNLSYYRQDLETVESKRNAL